MSFAHDTNNAFAEDDSFGSDSPFGSSSPFGAANAFAGFAPQTPPDGCTQCGSCLFSCPTFVKSEDPEQSPMGRIRLMRALEEGSGEGMAIEKLDSCLGCYSCEAICPSRVEYGKLLDESLVRLREHRPMPDITRKMLQLALKPALLKRLMQAAYLGQVTGLRGLAARLGLLKTVGLERANELLGKISFPAKLQNRIENPQSEQRVALFTGCFSSVMERDVQQAAIDVFNALGMAVTVPEGQGCCGALHRHNGEPETAEALARNNIQSFSAEQADAIVTTSSGCGASLKAYDDWLEGETLPSPVMDVSHYLAGVLRGREITFNNLPLKVALHTPCTLRQSEGQEEAVLELLKKIPGLDIQPLSGLPRCCGAGGSQMLSQPEMADALRDDAVAEIKAMGPDVVISSNLGCAMHLRAGLEQVGMDIVLKHPVQLVNSALSMK